MSRIRLMLAKWAARRGWFLLAFKLRNGRLPYEVW